MPLFRTEVSADGTVKQIEQAAYKDADGAVHVLDADQVVPEGWVSYAPEPVGITAEQIAARRYEAEVGGITLNGMQIDTDDRSKLLINGAALEATIDPSYTMQWKTLSGFVDLNAQQVIAIARAVRAHVQACFDREAELLAHLEAGTFTEDMLEEGWPS